MRFALLRAKPATLRSPAQFRSRRLLACLLTANLIAVTQPLATAQEKPEIKPPPAAQAPATEVVEMVELLDPSLEANWQHFTTKQGVALSDVWKIVVVDKEKHLVCLGDPKGFLFTKKDFDSFELTFEWRYPKDPNGNSGVLIYTREEPRLWPTSMQVQLHQPQAGALFATGDATSNKPFDAGLAGRQGDWNRCRIFSINGRLSVEINGQKAGQAEGCKPSSGRIALQSEGSETHFRRLRLKTLRVVPSQAAQTADREPDSTNEDS